MFTLPDFREMDDSDLRRTIADLRFQRDVCQDFLSRAETEALHRKADKREGVFRVRPVPTPDDSKPH